ncbi:MAG: trimeric intracellular cation channel family protein [Phycisphaerae bacterium]
MIQIIEFCAVISAALFGILLARSKGMDFIGVCSLAFIVAFGGGTLRDVLLDRQPLFWIEHDHYAWIVFAIAIIGSILPRLPARFENWLDIPDALGLAFFSVVGAGVAIDVTTFNVSPFLATLFGVITGTFGGVIGDIASNEIPRLFRPATRLYASCSFIGCWVYLLLRDTALSEPIALWTGVTVIVLMRLAALRWNLRLPASPA